MVVRRGQIRRIGWVIKTVEAQVGQFLLCCKCPVSRFLPGRAKALSAPRLKTEKYPAAEPSLPPASTMALRLNQFITGPINRSVKLTSHPMNKISNKWSYNLHVDPRVVAMLN
jgi:hypothetical protein